MANPGVGQFFHGGDRLAESVWVVVDPRDLVTGQRVSGPLQVRLKSLTPQPIAARSGVYCFVDLALPPAKYVVQVQPLSRNRERYFAAERELNLVNVPVPGQPLQRNPIRIELLPRPDYPFEAQFTLARGRLVKASDATPVPNARVVLILEGTDLGRRGQTDERGAFALCFPRAAPGTNPADAPKDLTFELRFEVVGGPSHTTPPSVLREGTTKALDPIQFPGI